MERSRVNMDHMDNSLEKFGLEKDKQIGGLLVRRKDFLLSSFNDRRSLSLFKYW